jgi:hypothetical protein
MARWRNLAEHATDCVVWLNTVGGTGHMKFCKNFMGIGASR